jgi:hypothetical protein
MPDEPIDIRKWFIDQPDAPPDIYELALVLGGTVSAGCYTAGAPIFISWRWTAAPPTTSRSSSPEPRSAASKAGTRATRDWPIAACCSSIHSPAK